MSLLWWARIAATLLLASGGAAVVLTYRHAIAEARDARNDLEQAQLSIAGWKAAADYWQREKDRADRAIGQRDRDLVRERDERAKLHAELEAARRDDPQIRAWADTPLPRGVVDRLRAMDAPAAPAAAAGADPGRAPRPDR